MKSFFLAVRSFSRPCGLCLFASAFCAFASLTVRAQGTATLAGRVTDERGAAIAGARVEARNVRTDLARTMTTNDAGPQSGRAVGCVLSASQSLTAKQPPRVIPRKYGAPRIVNFIEAEQHTSERLLREASGNEPLALTGEVEAQSDESQSNESTPGTIPSSAITTETVAQVVNDGETADAAANGGLTISKTVKEDDIIKEKTRESINHILHLFDGASSAPTNSSAAEHATLDRVLNP